MKTFDGWSSEPRSGTSTNNARMAAESGWSLGTRHVDKPGTSLHPSFQWQERITFRRWLDNTHPTSKHKRQGYGVIIISPVHRKGDEMPIIASRHWFRQWLGAEGNKPSPESLLTNMIIISAIRWQGIYTSKGNQNSISAKCYSDVIMSVMAFQIAGVYIVCLTVCVSAIRVHKANSRRNYSRCFLTKIWYDTYSKHIKIQQYGFMTPVPGETILGVS